MGQLAPYAVLLAQIGKKLDLGQTCVGSGSWQRTTQVMIRQMVKGTRPVRVSQARPKVRAGPRRHNPGVCK